MNSTAIVNKCITKYAQYRPSGIVVSGVDCGAVGFVPESRERAPWVCLVEPRGSLEDSLKTAVLDKVLDVFYPFKVKISGLSIHGQIDALKIHRGKELEVPLSLALALSTIQVTVRISSVKFSEGTIHGDTTYLHLHDLVMELKEEKYSPVPCTCDLAHKTFGPTDLTSVYSVCPRRVFGGIEHRTQTFRSGVQCFT
ncbi:hypothetical protein TNCV_5103881 [Trichonephila clavipes]|nr:hypothetical protein TNCV_5103881 [Trichonephila clavipes]